MHVRRASSQFVRDLAVALSFVTVQAVSWQLPACARSRIMASSAHRKDFGIAPFMSEKITSLTCWICGKSVRLEDCKSDDYGHTVHEECYIAAVLAEQKQKTETDS